VLVLLVEDNENNAAAVAWALSLEGFEVITVHRGLEVVPKIIDTRPDAVVLDISLPDLNGVAVATMIRAQWADLPIIFTTGHERYAGLDAALAMPKTSMLLKPYTIAALAAMIYTLAG
jgi:DNA-binding response OmpR family regulator